jgi:hypothetical protein
MFSREREAGAVKEERWPIDNCNAQVVLFGQGLYCNVVVIANYFNLSSTTVQQ